MKENDGRAARRKRAKQMMWLAGLAVTCCLLTFMVFPSSSHNDGRNNGKRLRNTALTRTRQLMNEVHGAAHEQAMHFRQRLKNQFEEQDEGELLQQVLNGELNLVEVRVVEDDLVRSPASTYNGVYGLFCKLNWNLHKEDPSGVPMFRDIVAKSPDCNRDDEELVHLDIKKIANLITTHHETTKLLNLTAVVFHESRCGSTLVANNLIAMNPQKHRVYSESAPAAFAIKSACGDNYSRCSEEQTVEIFKDVLTIMSIAPSDSKEESVFLKFQSITTKHLTIFQQAFPHVPWMFIYRDPVQVMMSHFKDTRGDLSRAICTRTQQMGTRNIPNDIKEIARAHDTSAMSLSHEEYCAAHLAAITEAAVHALQQNPMGIPINYDKLPDILWEEVLPHKVLGRPLTSTEISNMKEVSTQYSKGRGAKHGQEFQGDSQSKEQAATPAVHQAAKDYLQESFDQLSKYQSPKIFE